MNEDEKLRCPNCDNTQFVSEKIKMKGSYAEATGQYMIGLRCFNCKSLFRDALTLSGTRLLEQVR